jgi:transposase
MEDSR